jgi:hypothetical protein
MGKLTVLGREMRLMFRPTLQLLFRLTGGPRSQKHSAGCC